MRKIKNIFSLGLVLTFILHSVYVVSAEKITVSFDTPYGTMIGNSYTETWSPAGTVTYRKVAAQTNITNAVPNIYAKVEGQVNNKIVMEDETTSQDASSVTAYVNTSSYVNATVSGYGTHAVWSSTFTRQNKMSSF